jgi:hypothetical protein
MARVEALQQASEMEDIGTGSIRRKPLENAI